MSISRDILVARVQFPRLLWCILFVTKVNFARNFTIKTVARIFFFAEKGKFLELGTKTIVEGNKSSDDN